MNGSIRWSRKLALAGLLPLLAIACSKTETETVNPPRVIVSGQFAILAGSETQLTATTANGSDAGYTWASSNTNVATVSATGLVKGVVPGTATITATGTTSNLSGTFNVAVANEIPQQTAWLSSGHADASGEPFNHWNGEGSVSKSCARCHSTPGFRDYLGDDGSAPWVVDQNAPLGTVVSCEACHNATATTLSEVTFPYPSAKPETKRTITGLGPEARCMTCHQGRESTSTVDAAIETAFATTDLSSVDPDQVSTALGFKNVHYLGAGATLNGGRAAVGYQYEGKSYDVRFRHVPERDSCIECHDPHSLQVNPATCATCHTGVSTAADFHNIRFRSSAVDYDGDGNVTEGIAGELDGLRDALNVAMTRYTAALGTAGICYDGARYPYFFSDSDSDGDCATGTTGTYRDWTVRLVRATFNYKFSVADPGAFAHNAKYVIQLMFDSIEDLNAGTLAAATPGTPVDMSAMHRDDIGHFEGSAEPARHWDEDGAVSSSCSRCHGGAEGFRWYAAYGVSKTVEEPGNGLDCVTCHASFPVSQAAPNIVSIASVTFPSGKKVSPNPDGAWGARLTGSSFVCMTCHQGREAKSTVDKGITDSGITDPDQVSTLVKFKNVHYLPAGAVLLGKEAGVGYEYTGKTYVSRDTHPLGIDCNACHSAVGTKHTFQPQDNLAACRDCHGPAGAGGPIPTLEDLRGAKALGVLDDFDYDGDGDVTESLASELDGLSTILLETMQAYSTASGGALICYDPGTYPYFLEAPLPDDCTGADTGYTDFTPRLSKAAFNMHLAHKEPGAWAHNMKYISQLLFDSIQDLDPAAVTGITRAGP